MDRPLVHRGPGFPALEAQRHPRSGAQGGGQAFVVGFEDPGLQWTTSDAALATVAANGVAEARARGRVLITVAVAAEPAWRATAILDNE